MSDEKYVRYVNATSEYASLYPAQRSSWSCEELAVRERNDRFPKTYKITVEEVEEEPQMWHWDFCGREWSRTQSLPNHGMVFGDSLEVYGTTADRDAKRDALLAAARAAGKGGEG